MAENSIDNPFAPADTVIGGNTPVLKDLKPQGILQSLSDLCFNSRLQIEMIPKIIRADLLFDEYVIDNSSHEIHYTNEIQSAGLQEIDKDHNRLSLRIKHSGYRGNFDIHTRQYILNSDGEPLRSLKTPSDWQAKGTSYSKLDFDQTKLTEMILNILPQAGVLDSINNITVTAAFSYSTADGIAGDCHGTRILLTLDNLNRWSRTNQQQLGLWPIDKGHAYKHTEYSDGKHNYDGPFNFTDVLIVTNNKTDENGNIRTATYANELHLLNFEIKPEGERIARIDLRTAPQSAKT